MDPPGRKDSQAPCLITELLPIEIWQRILQFAEYTEGQQSLLVRANLYDGCSLDPFEEDGGQSRSLPKRFCLLSKATFNFATSSLYRLVDIYSNHGLMERLDPLLYSVQIGRANLIQRLSIEDAELDDMQTICEIITACPNMAEVTIIVVECPDQAWNISPSLQFRQVRELNVHWQAWPCAGADFVAAFTNLDHLTIKGAGFRALSIAHAPSKITKLTLWEVEQPAADDLLKWLRPVAANIRSLVIKDVHPPPFLGGHFAGMLAVNKFENLEGLVYDNDTISGDGFNMISEHIAKPTLKRLTLCNFRAFQLDQIALQSVSLPLLENLTLSNVGAYVGQLANYFIGPNLKTVRCLSHGLLWHFDPDLMAAKNANYCGKWELWNKTVERLVKESAERGVALTIEVNIKNFDA